MLRLNQKYIEKIFYDYDRIKRAVGEARRDSSKGKSGGNGSGHAFVSDPTANAAMRAATPLAVIVLEARKGMTEERIREPEKWLRVVDETYSFFSGRLTADVLRRRFAGEGYGDTCNALNISKSIYYCYYDEGMHYAQLCAVGLGLMTPFKR